MGYVDGFVVPVPKANVEAYRAMSESAGQIWRDHGALQYWECVGDDLSPEGVFTFPELVNLPEDETVIFAFIVFQSREHRDEVNAKVMADERLKCDLESNPFDMKRMAYGGFKTIVKLGGPEK